MTVRSFEQIMAASAHKVGVLAGQRVRVVSKAPANRRSACQGCIFDEGVACLRAEFGREEQRQFSEGCTQARVIYVRA